MGCVFVKIQFMPVKDGPSLVRLKISHFRGIKIHLGAMSTYVDDHGSPDITVDTFYILCMILLHVNDFPILLTVGSRASEIWEQEKKGRKRKGEKKSISSFPFPSVSSFSFSQIFEV